MNKKLFFLFFYIFSLFFFPLLSRAETFDEKLGGRILLQVEENGEAWFVSPKTYMRTFLGRPADAFSLMREFGLGISNLNLEKIPIALGMEYGLDSDEDGLGDRLEDSIGTDKNKSDSDGDNHSDWVEVNTGNNPNGDGRYVYDNEFAEKHLGEIFLQVEKNGEAWYINPVDKKRYFLGRPSDAFSVMRQLGLGISNADLAKITVSNNDSISSDLEFLLHADVNQERTKNDLEKLKWNESLAKVARTHSQSLADENKPFAGIGRACDYPMIHHEDLKYGFYNTERLNENNIYYYSEAGENIALYSAASYKVLFYEGDQVSEQLANCSAKRDILSQSLKERISESDDNQEKRNIIEAEIKKRIELFNSQSEIVPKDLNWYENNFLSADITSGWMDSPGHRDNILNADYDEAGVGVVVANGYVYATQVFIKRAECGFKDGPCCTKKGFLPYCFVPLECNNNNNLCFL